MEIADLFVVGAGVAGLSAGIYGARSGLKTVVADIAGAGGQVMQIDDLENYPGVFPAVKGSSLIQTMKAQAEHFGAKVLQLGVLSIDKSGDFFKIRTDREEYTGRTLIFATGAEHRTICVPGEEEFFGAGVSYCAVCDGPFFKNRNVVVVGGGDSACSEAIYLSGIAKHVTVIHRRDSFRATQAVQDKMFACENISVEYNSAVKEIKGDGVVKSVLLENTVDKSRKELAADGVFIFVGMNPMTKLLDFIQKDKSGYIITNEKMETSIPGLYCAGDVRSKPLRQIVTAASDGAVAAFSAKEFLSK